jgi:acyl CoA:acetate/3-ketoacid CoA transferase beta subunit
MMVTAAELGWRVARELDLRARASVWLSPALDASFTAAMLDSADVRLVSDGARVDIAVVAASRLSATGELEAPGPPRAELVLGVLWLARGGAIVRGPLRPSAVRADRVFTELGVLDVTQDGLVLIELAAGVSAADFQRQAEPTLLVSPRISEMKLRADSLDDGRTEQ